MTESRFASRFNTDAIPILNEEFGVSVQLARGHLVSPAMTARRPPRFTIGMGQELDVGIRVETREYLLPVAGCSLDGVNTQPRAGDYVIEGGERWEVFVPDDASQASQISSTDYDWVTQVRRVRDDGVQRC